MEDGQLQVEIDWCLDRLEEKLAGLDPYSRPAQEAAKVHHILKSSKAPLIKKRQAMRNMFGDYRTKIKATEKKSLAAMKKSKLVPVKKPPKDSRFFRVCRREASERSVTSAEHEASERSITSVANNLNQLSVNEGEPQSDPQATCVTESESATSSDLFTSDGDFKFNFDSSECGMDAGSMNDAVASASTSGNENYFVIKPSNEEFRFNFTLDEHDEK